MTSARVAGRSGLVAFAAVVLLAGAGLAGCGGDDGEVAEAAAAAEPVTVPATDPQGGTTDAETTTETTATTGDDPSAPTDDGSTTSATGEPDLCEDLAAVRGSVETMRDATIGEGAVPVVAEEVLALEASLPELRASAAAQYETQVAEVETGMAAVRTSVEAAQADTSAATLLTVTTAVRAFGATVDGLVQDVGDTC